MIEEVRNQMASTQAYINGLRLDKKDLDKLAEKEWVVVNGRVAPQRRATQARVRSTYVQFNFKAAILSDEKQERLVSVLMDAHTGNRVAETELIETQASATEPDTVLQSLPDAPIRWQPGDNQPLKDPLDQRTLTALLERAKSADIADRYRVRLNLTLLNLKVTRQPKLLVPVNIENRATKINAYAVWDPLRHRLEPLACAVCGLPIRRAFLCHNGHLADEDCLAPACVDCKRIFCRQCADEIGECAVCHEPLCSYSRIRCDDCGRGTCQEHQGMCHANDGQPVDLTVQTTPPEPEPDLTPKPEPAPKTPQRPKPTRSKSSRKPKRIPRRPIMPKGVPKPQRIEMDSFELFGLWKEEEILAETRASFERIYWE